jgi:hypothetical protein
MQRHPNTASTTTQGASNQPIALFALNNGGTLSNFSSDQISAFFLGGGLTSAQAFDINTRINAYMAALGHNIF